VSFVTVVWRALASLCRQNHSGAHRAVQGKADDYEIAAAQIGVEVYSAMNAALGS